MNTSRSHRRSISPKWCEESSSVVPRAASARSTSTTRPRREGSRPSVGSSRMRTRTSGASAAHSTSWRFIPWLNVRTRERSGRAELVRQLARARQRRPAVGASAQEPLEVLAGAHLGVEVQLAGRVGHALAHRQPVALQPHAVDRGRPGVGAHQAGQRAQQRALAAAVGADQPGHAAGPDVEVERGQGQRLAEAPGQAADHDAARGAACGSRGGVLQPGRGGRSGVGGDPSGTCGRLGHRGSVRCASPRTSPERVPGTGPRSGEAPARGVMSEPDDIRTLKSDALGRVERIVHDGTVYVRRVACGGRLPGSAWLARRLLARERRALERLATLDGVPRLPAERVAHELPPPAGSRPGAALVRSWIDGEPLSRAEALPVDFFDRLDELVQRVHAAGVCHNDLHKEQNVLVRADGSPALVDFQLASRHARAGGASFRSRVRDDLRHVQKHRRRYTRAGRGPGEELVAPEQQERLARGAGHGLRRTPLAWLWRRLGKPAYVFVTRRVFDAADGAEERRPSSGPWPRWTPALRGSAAGRDPSPRASATATGDPRLPAPPAARGRAGRRRAASRSPGGGAGSRRRRGPDCIALRGP